MHKAKALPFSFVACVSLFVGIGIGACSLAPPDGTDGPSEGTRPTRGKLSVRSDGGPGAATRLGDAGHSDAGAGSATTAANAANDAPSDCTSLASDPQACLQCCMKNNRGGGAGDATFDRCMRDAGSQSSCTQMADAACAADPKCAALSACVKNACPKK